MRLRAYKGTMLAASIDEGRPPAYHGEPGRQARALVEGPAAGAGPARDGEWGEPGRWLERARAAGLPEHGFLLVGAGAANRDGGPAAG